MRIFLFCLWMSVAVGGALAADVPVERLLAATTAVHRDEIFTFHVTYSDVHLLTNEFQFVQTLLHEEELGSYKVVVTCRLPLGSLKAASRTVLVNDGIGRNTFVRIALPDATPASAISIHTELVAEDGSRKTETRQLPFMQCDLDFPDQEAADAWNRALAEALR